MSTMPPTFGDQLRRYRLRAGLSQAALAERAGIAAATISALERGVRRLPYPHTQQQLATALVLSARERAEFTGGLRGRSTESQDSHSTSNLLHERTSLLGRDDEISRLESFIQHDGTRLVTLTGIGGCGKTRLARRVAADLADAFPDGRLFVELAPLSDANFLPQTIALAFGLHEESGVAFRQTLIFALRHRSMLLVLDNCEHLIEACATLVEELLNTCPTLRILTTSREPLQIAGEQCWLVPPLATPEETAFRSVGEIAAFPAVQLFVERARSVSPDFALTAENAAAVASICRQLGGLPLALELAAGRVRVLTPCQILTHLDDAIRLLTGGSRVGPTRQESLLAALDWSYRLLTKTEQIAFARLAALAGTFDLAAAEAVCSANDLLDNDVLDVLTRLVTKSIVLTEEYEGEVCFRLLEPLRQYAARHLNADDATPTRERHARYFRAFAERIEPLLHGAEQMRWFDHLERDSGNLRLALQHTIDCDQAEVGLRLALALTPFWEGRSRLSEGRQWLDALLELPSSRAITPALRARTLLAGGRLAQWQAQLDEAIRLLKACVQLAEPLADQSLMTEALVYLGTVRRRQGAFDESVDLIEQGLARYRAAGDSPGIALALLTLGVTERYQRATARSVAHLEESLERFRQSGDIRWIAMALGMLGSSLLAYGDVAHAATCIREALALQQTVGDRAFSVFGLIDLAIIFGAQAQPLRAAQVLGAMLTLTESVSIPLTPLNQNIYERILDSLREQVSPTELARALAVGRRLSLEAALAELPATTLQMN